MENNQQNDDLKRIHFNNLMNDLLKKNGKMGNKTDENHVLIPLTDEEISMFKDLGKDMSSMVTFIIDALCQANIMSEHPEDYMDFVYDASKLYLKEVYSEQLQQFEKSQHQNS